METISAKPRILVYQSSGAKELEEYLDYYGFEVIPVSKDNILKKLKTAGYDLCILDHLESGAPGNITPLMYLRSFDEKMPVIMVSELSDYPYKIEAFKLGADDYIIRPYNLEELISRVKALLRRCGIRLRNIEKLYQIGTYTFDVESRILKRQNDEVKLTEKENKILALLCAYKNEILPKPALLREIWVDDNYFNKRSLDVHMCHLRTFLKKDSKLKISTIRGLGYSLVEDL